MQEDVQIRIDGNVLFVDQIKSPSVDLICLRRKEEMIITVDFVTIN